MTTLASKPKIDRYLKLVSEFPLVPIHTRAEHEHTLKRLRDLQGSKDAPSMNYKQVLVTLIVDYEKRMGWHRDTSHVTAADIVRHLLEDRDMSVNALAKQVGISQSSLSEMLSGRRGWSKSAIIKLTDYFGLNPKLFLK